ncbi:hypothetical protein K432DRAFT_209390 [Lepidopterella palustris CBS 459.81]|uniref:Uncharacterized protein n=1 Tax=Lepidopterella palustris CBS 459.81 TaxID=1314670 RepID=A0A8E2DYQ9_9PEZI|nr:hypothetical protein K432DRAFT_209390 [Lepidopterella palustris CBS 459.81]
MNRAMAITTLTTIYTNFLGWAARQKFRIPTYMSWVMVHGGKNSFPSCIIVTAFLAFLFFSFLFFSFLYFFSPNTLSGFSFCENLHWHLHRKTGVPVVTGWWRCFYLLGFGFCLLVCVVRRDEGWD